MSGQRCSPLKVMLHATALHALMGAHAQEAADRARALKRQSNRK
jgi:hypothetical protein